MSGSPYQLRSRSRSNNDSISNQIDRTSRDKRIKSPGRNARKFEGDAEKSVFVTVGTTKFDSLIELMQTEEILSTLIHLGFRKLILQYGTGNAPKRGVFKNSDGEIKIESFSLSPSINGYIKNAALVIGHGGAGTITETLKNQKPIIVVVNETLMNNHQNQLVHAMSRDNYALQASPSTLNSILMQQNWTNLKTFELPGDTNPFVNILDEWVSN